MNKYIMLYLYHDICLLCYMLTMLYAYLPKNKKHKQKNKKPNKKTNTNTKNQTKKEGEEDKKLSCSLDFLFFHIGHRC